MVDEKSDSTSLRFPFAYLANKKRKVALYARLQQPSIAASEAARIESAKVPNGGEPDR